MTEATTYTPDYSEAFKDRLKLLPFFIVLYATTHWLNNSLWSLNTIMIWWVIVLLIPVKLLFIIFGLVYLWRVEEKKTFFLIFLPIILLFAYMFDIETVPFLSVYRQGTETKGTVVELIKTSKSRFVVYDYSVGNVVFQKQQDTSVSYYESLATGTVVAVKYDPGNPGTAFLVDVQELKNQTWFTLFMGFGAVLMLYVGRIQEAISLSMKNRLRASKPA